MEPAAWDDATLAIRCASREEAAWRELLRRAGPTAYHVMRKVFRRADFPDPAAEAEGAMGGWAAVLLEKNARVLRAYRPRVPLRIYLGAVARRVAFRVLEKRDKSLPLEKAEDLSWVPVESSVDAERLREAMAGLEPRENLLLKLIYWQELNYEEAGRILGLEADSIGPLLTRIREKLRQKIG